MAFLDGISLGEQINCMKEKKELYDESRIWKIVLQLIQALRYLHKSKGIIHRDLTPYNIIIGDKDYVTITDFGLAKQRLLESRGREARSILGTLTYVCPEVIRHQPYGEKADIWALGCIVYQMCTLTQPFTAQSELDLVNKICHLKYVTLDKFISPFTNEKLNYSPKIHLFIGCSIVLDPTSRYDVIGLAALFVEDILVTMDEIEKDLSKESQSKKKLENQFNQANDNKYEMNDINFPSLQSSSLEASPSVSSANNQIFDDLNADSTCNEKGTFANYSDFKQPDITNQSNQIISPMSSNRMKFSKCSVLDSSNAESNCKKNQIPMSSINEARARSLNSKSLMTISQKSLRHITEDPITRMLTWLHKIYFLSRADFQNLKQGPNPETDLIRTKRYFKMIFESLFKLHPDQMKIELNNMISGRGSTLPICSLSNHITPELFHVSSEKLHYLMDDFLEKLNY